MCQIRVNKPKLPYLPCFTMVATGTCAFGAHCSFMHDERCLLRPKNLRKQIEHDMINHLLQYRSSKKRFSFEGSGSGADPLSDEETFVQPYQSAKFDDDSIDSQDEYCPEFRSAASSISFSRDSFFWPQMQYTPAQIVAMSKVPYGKSKNTYSYDPLPNNDFGKYVEEMSSWYHYLSSLDSAAPAMFRDPAFRWNAVTKKSRLPCFQQLAHGQSM